jgi:hypothetical protein
MSRIAQIILLSNLTPTKILNSVWKRNYSHTFVTVTFTLLVVICVHTFEELFLIFIFKQKQSLGFYS